MNAEHAKVGNQQAGTQSTTGRTDDVYRGRGQCWNRTASARARRSIVFGQNGRCGHSQGLQHFHHCGEYFDATALAFGWPPALGTSPDVLCKISTVFGKRRREDCTRRERMRCFLSSKGAA